MKLSNAKSLLMIVIMTSAVFVTFNMLSQTASAETSFTAWHTDNTMTIDGVADEADWAIADALVVTNYGATSRTDGNITLKFLNDGTNLYFYAEWDDADEQSNRKGWTWNSTYYNNLGGNEDRFAIAWANTTTGMVCGHTSYTGAPAGMLFDVWHWKATRGASGWADDKWWDSAGRNSDAKTSGGYSENSVVAQAANDAEITTKLGNSTAVSSYGAGDLPYWYDNGTVIPWSAGAVVGDTPAGILGYIESQPVGSRGDITTEAVYSGAKWHLEGMRSLAGTPADDVVFVPGGTYDFWIAQMDNSGGTHAADLAMKFSLKVSGSIPPVTVQTTIVVPTTVVQPTTVDKPTTVTSTTTESGYSM
ncbi:MAG: ethylbenzene dehydrogenase-related protein, partial [Candidatus Kariarchaeaceae archaeon]